MLVSFFEIIRTIYIISIFDVKNIHIHNYLFIDSFCVWQKSNNRNSSSHILCKIRQVTGRKFFFIPVCNIHIIIFSFFPLPLEEINEYKRMDTRIVKPQKNSFIIIIIYEFEDVSGFNVSQKKFSMVFLCLILFLFSFLLLRS